MKKPRQVEVNEAEKKAIKDSHKFAKAVTQPKKMTGTGMSTIPKQKEEKAASKKQPNAGRTKEMDEVLNEIAGVKMLNENMGAKTSTRAKEMFEKMKETRRAKHVDTMNEYEEWLETFGDSMKERYEDRKKQTESLISTSSMEINKTLSSMTDEILLTSKIEYVTQSWDHISNIRKERKKEISSLAEMLNELHRVKSNSIMEYLTTFKDKLVDIAFLLEPQIATMVEEMVSKQQVLLEKEKVDMNEYIEKLTSQEQEKFELYYSQWKEKKERYHILKQEEAISNFQKQINEKHFVNPEPRVDQMRKLKKYQLEVYNVRLGMLKNLQAIPIGNITKDKVNEIDDQLKKLSDSSQETYKVMIGDLVTLRDNLNKEALSLIDSLRSFLNKNDAKLEEGSTYDSLIEAQCMPLVKKRLDEYNNLLMHVDKYLEEYDTRMHEYSKNIITFYRFIGESYDKKRKDVQDLELQFEIAIAKLADQNEEAMNKRDEDLKARIDSLKKSVTQITLVERLYSCYGLLNCMNQEYDNFDKELANLIATQEPKILDTFSNFELKLIKHYKMDSEEARERIQARLTQETEEKQKKLEEEYLRKKELEEQKAAEAAGKAQPPAKGKGKVPEKGKGKGKETAVLDVPKLEVPPVLEYKSPSGATYVIDWTIEMLAESLMHTEEELERIKAEQDRLEEERKKKEAAEAEAKETKKTAKKLDKKQEQAMQEEEERLRKEREEEEEKIRAEQQEKERLRANVPVDPEGEKCLNENLLLTKGDVIEILSNNLTTMMNQINTSKSAYLDSLKSQNTETYTKSMKDVDSQFQRTWPNTDDIEIDAFQTRQSEITNHKKLYDKHVRSVLKKNDIDERKFEALVLEFKTMIDNYENLLSKYIDALNNFSNLAELQGYLRKTKEAYNILTEQINKYRDDFSLLSTTELDILLKTNRSFVHSCTLQENGGTYSEDEKAYYNALITHIDDRFSQAREQRQNTASQLLKEAEQKRDEPYAKFEAKYSESNLSHAAKEGLGKVFGKPKRMLQDQIKGEMSKCDEAQKALDSLLEKLRKLLSEYAQHTDKTLSLAYTFNQNSQRKSGGKYFLERSPTLSSEIKNTLITIRNCIIKYGKYLSGLKEDFVSEELKRMTFIETSEDLTLTEDEQKKDPEIRLNELRTLGSIGMQIGTDKDLDFITALDKIENNIKEVARKLYEKDNPTLLQGPDKIPEYLENYLRSTRAQAEEFRLSCVRNLRNTSNSLSQLADRLPEAIFGSIELMMLEKIDNQTIPLEAAYEKQFISNETNKKTNLMNLRPNLSNPACRDELQDLDTKSVTQFTSFVDLIDKTQINLLNILENETQEFFQRLVYATGTHIEIFTSLLFNDEFILLPGDDISEKKHLNLKNLLVQREKEGGYVERTNRGLKEKWKGLSKKALKIDYSQRPEYKKEEEKREIETAEDTPSIESIKTTYHKALIKQRDESFRRFRAFFEDRVARYFSLYDSHRVSEHRFRESWEKKVSVLRAKQDIKS